MVPFMFDELSTMFKTLVGPIFKKDAIDNAQSIASMLNEKLLQDSKNQLEPGLVDIVAGTKAVLASAQVAAEKKRDCFDTNAKKLSSKSSLSWRNDAHFSSAL